MTGHVATQGMAGYTGGVRLAACECFELLQQIILRLRVLHLFRHERYKLRERDLAVAVVASVEDTLEFSVVAVLRCDL